MIKRSTPSRIAFVLACVLLLAIPGLATLAMRGDSLSAQEGRRLAAAPDVATLLSAPAEFTRSTDAFLRERFGLRDAFLTLNSSVRRIAQAPASQKVVIGRDGWLFYTPGLLDRPVASNPGVASRLRSQADLIAAMSFQLAKRGVPLSVLVAPDKHTIYPEMLPAWLPPPTEPSAYSGLVELLRARHVAVTDIRPALLSGKVTAPMYFRTDTHWTTFAALIGFNATLEAVGRPAIAAKRPIRVRESESAVHDLARMSLMAGTFPDYVVAWFESGRGRAIAKPLKIRDPTNNAYMLERAGPGITTVIIGDSFSREPFKEMALTFSNRLVFAHHQKCSFDWPALTAMKPDLVIYEVVERAVGCDQDVVERQLAAIRAMETHRSARGDRDAPNSPAMLPTRVATGVRH